METTNVTTRYVRDFELFNGDFLNHERDQVGVHLFLHDRTVMYRTICYDYAVVTDHHFLSILTIPPRL